MGANTTVPFYTIISIILASILLTCSYLIWRGPHRTIFPCLPFNRNRDSVSMTSTTQYLTGSQSTHGDEKRSMDGGVSGIGWSGGGGTSNTLLARMRAEREVKRVDKVNQILSSTLGNHGGGYGSTTPVPRSILIPPRKIAKLSKSPKYPQTTKTARIAQPVSMIPTISSFGHTPGQNTIYAHPSWTGGPSISTPESAYSICEPQVARPVPGTYSPIGRGLGGPIYPQPATGYFIPSHSTQPPISTHNPAIQPQPRPPRYSPYTPGPSLYSASSVYPPTPPTAHISPSISRSMTSLVTPTIPGQYHHHPYPIFTNLSTPTMLTPTTSSPSSMITSTSSTGGAGNGNPMFNLFLPETASPMNGTPGTYTPNTALTPATYQMPSSGIDTRARKHSSTFSAFSHALAAAPATDWGTRPDFSRPPPLSHNPIDPPLYEGGSEETDQSSHILLGNAPPYDPSHAARARLQIHTAPIQPAPQQPLLIHPQPLRSSLHSTHLSLINTHSPLTEDLESGPQFSFPFLTPGETTDAPSPHIIFSTRNNPTYTPIRDSDSSSCEFASSSSESTFTPNSRASSSGLSDLTPRSSMYGAVPPLKKVKRGSYAAHASRMSHRVSNKAPPSPLRQSIASVGR